MKNHVSTLGHIYCDIEKNNPWVFKRRIYKPDLEIAYIISGYKMEKKHKPGLGLF